MCAQVPVCEVTYLTRFILNTIVLPVCLILLVAGTWTANTRERSWHRQLCLKSKFKSAEKAKGDATVLVATDNGYDEQQASKYSDYYFVVFLCCESRTLPQPSDIGFLFSLQTARKILECEAEVRLRAFPCVQTQR